MSLEKVARRVFSSPGSASSLRIQRLRLAKSSPAHCCAAEYFDYEGVTGRNREIDRSTLRAGEGPWLLMRHADSSTFTWTRVDPTPLDLACNAVI